MVLSRRRFLQGLTAVTAAGCATLRSRGSAGNPTRSENEKAGALDWEVTQPAMNREIEGYASRTSVNRGEPIQLFVSTADPSYARRTIAGSGRAASISRG